MKRILVNKGSEADIYLEGETIIKKRIKKTYRLPEIDETLRKSRTRGESRFLDLARRIGVHVPKVYDTDMENHTIKIQHLPGKLLKDEIDSGIVEHAGDVGRAISKLHKNSMIHNDLTTSNLLVADGTVHFIDFGLCKISRRVEDKAMDLVILKKTLRATHPQQFKAVWNRIVENYDSPDADLILNRVDGIEKRVRYHQNE